MKRFLHGLIVISVWSAVLIVGSYNAGVQQQQDRVETLALQAHGEPRSPHWPKVRAAFLATHKTCAVCGANHDLEIHHCLPFHTHPELELEDSNLITLCRPHHQLIGHLMEWKSWNADVRDDASALLKKIRNRP